MKTIIERIDEALAKRVIHLTKDEKEKILSKYLSGSNRASQPNTLAEMMEDFTMYDLTGLRDALDEIIKKTKNT